MPPLSLPVNHQMDASSLQGSLCQICQPCRPCCFSSATQSSPKTVQAFQSLRSKFCHKVLSLASITLRVIPHKCLLIPCCFPALLLASFFGLQAALPIPKLRKLGLSAYNALAASVTLVFLAWATIVRQALLIIEKKPLMSTHVKLQWHVLFSLSSQTAPTL